MRVPERYRRLTDWPALEQAAAARLAGHGDFSRWQSALDSLPDLIPDRILLGDRVTAAGTLTGAQRDQLIGALQTLRPWRKGPFDLFGVHIDTEWRSDWKWRRIASSLGPLTGAQVLDVGCGNGYFGWRLLEAGAADVVGVDPSALFYQQHQAVCRYLNRLEARPNFLLPLAFEQLPEMPHDLVLSMGVIYHRPDPAEHVERLFRCTRPGGQVLLESLVVDGGGSLFPASTEAAGGRYARMRNVSIIPTVDTLSSWLTAAGFEQVQVVDVTPTSTLEQRRTEWMTFESLAESLEATDSGRTVEGFPAPVRAALLARRPDPNSQPDPC